MTKLRTQFTNRVYTTKFDNDTYHFIKSLNPNGMLKDIAEKLDISYYSLYYAFRIDRITYSLKTKIDKNYKLTDNQLATLKDLVSR